MKNGKIETFTDLNVWKAEGFGRQSYKEKVQFYYMAKGSLSELKNFILIAKDINYLTSEHFKQLAEQATIVDQLLQGLIRKSKTFINQKSSIVNQVINYG